MGRHGLSDIWHIGLTGWLRSKKFTWQARVSCELPHLNLFAAPKRTETPLWNLDTHHPEPASLPRRLLASPCFCKLATSRQVVASARGDRKMPLQGLGMLPGLELLQVREEGIEQRVLPKLLKSSEWRTKRMKAVGFCPGHLASEAHNN